MSGFTPGPWRVGKGKYGYQIWQDVKNGFGNHWIANLKCESCPADEVPNAHLIAAAPDLLEALEDLANDYAERFDMDSQSTNPGMKVVVENARAAIAKARGTPC